jgi:outer membrane immunogenic protein
MSNNILAKRRLPLSVTAALLASFVALTPAESQAGGYIGGSVGQSYIELNTGTPTVPETFDEEDFGFKGFAGYDFDLAVINLGVELAYVDFGAPSGDVLGTQFELEVNGFAGFGTIGVDLGPVGVFGKYGVVSWDASISADGLDIGSEDGSDPAYGVGLKFGVGSLEVRGEYEIFDIEDSEDVAMVSVGLVWRF